MRHGLRNPLDNLYLYLLISSAYNLAVFSLNPSSMNLTSESKCSVKNMLSMVSTTLKRYPYTTEYTIVLTHQSLESYATGTGTGTYFQPKPSANSVYSLHCAVPNKHMLMPVHDGVSLVGSNSGRLKFLTTSIIHSGISC